MIREICRDTFFLSQKVMQVKFVDRTFNCNRRHATMIWQYLMDHDNGVTNFHMEITADLLDDETLNLLKHARKGLFQFEIGVQTTNPQTMKAIRRAVSFEKLSQVVQKIKAMEKSIAQELGFEKVSLKQGKMYLYFVGDEHKAYYQSEIFGRVLNYLQQNPRRCKLRELGGRRSMVVQSVSTVLEAVQILKEMSRTVAV